MVKYYIVIFKILFFYLPLILQLIFHRFFCFLRLLGHINDKLWKQFADLLDQNLQKVNSDYEAKRYKGIFLDRLELTPAPVGTFNSWLKEKKGKLGGQIKIPRLSNDRKYYEQLINIINK